MTYQEIIEAIENLPFNERNNLIKLIRQQQHPQSGSYANERREDEIAESGERIHQAITTGTAENFENPARPQSYLLTASEDEVHYIDRDGNSLNYHIKDLYPTDEGYDYVTSQGQIFDTCLPNLVDKYAGEYIVFEDGRVIDRDVDEDILLNRVWSTEFAISRRNKYHGIFCELVPEKLDAF